MNHRFPYNWNIADGYPATGIEKNGCKVFGTFICGGGSSMGYKLAGFEHLGGVEIDLRMAEVYKANHSPKHLFTEDIRMFNERTDLPEELFNLDILDGSPPCSTFSMAGSREKAWGKEKKFTEGQANQTLDDLVFTYCDTVLKLQPKVFILENVKGIIQGNARIYSKNIVKKMEQEYNVQVFCLNAASMGVPQKRERVFFIGLRKDIDKPRLNLKFNEKKIIFREIENGTVGQPITEEMLKYWKICPAGNSLSKVHPKGHYFGSHKIGLDQTANTIIASDSSPILHNKKPNYLSDDNICKIGSYPADYEFKNIKAKYLIGMSVPPVMTAQISNQIFEQWLKK